jgi:hypothetical protein
MLEKLNQDALKGNKFCILPWIHFHAWPDGKVFPCCMADSNKPTSDTNSESIIKMMNSEEFKAMRVRMLNDEPSSECQRCYDVEKFGTVSLRQSHNANRLGKMTDSLVENTNNDGSIDKFELKYLDIRFSNICNMKCRSCGPSCSSLWAKEYQERFSPETLQNRFGLKTIVVNNNEDDIFWEKLVPYLNDVEEVYFAGGEALITPEHYKILDYWLENNRTDVKVTYTTNLSVLRYKDKHVFDYWRKFPKVEIYASLDASESTAEVIRKGTNWQQIEDNVKRIKKEVPHVKLELTPTISLWNAWQFPKFHQDWINKGFLTKDQDIRLNILTGPWFASLLILPEEHKKQLIELYQPIVDDDSYSMSIRNAYKTVCNTLASGTPNKGGMREFIKFNNELDEVRKEKIVDTVPQLRELYEWAQSSD